MVRKISELSELSNSSDLVFKGRVLTGCVSRSQETVVAHRSLRDGYEAKNSRMRLCDRRLIVAGQKILLLFQAANQLA